MLLDNSGRQSPEIQWKRVGARVMCRATSKIESVLQGKAPSVQVAMDLYHLLGESSTHLHQPVGLETQLLEVDDMDSEVGNSMLQLLQVSLASVLEQH